MSKTARVVLALASAALLLLFVLPLWHIGLVAPQYPEGLGLHIFVDNVRGVGANDLQNINGLNHYVGMREITPAAIPELRYMPWVVVALVLLGLVAAAIGRRGLMYVWGGLLLLAAASLVMGQAAEGTPVVHVRGFPYALRDSNLRELVRPKDMDLFR